MIQVTEWVYLGLYWLCLGLGAFALIDAARRRSDAYPAVDRQTKRTWLLLLGGGLAAQIVFPVFSGFLGMLGLAGIVAAIVYLVDVRRKLIDITRGGSGW